MMADGLGFSLKNKLMNITLDLEQLARLFIEFEPYNMALDLNDILGDGESFLDEEFSDATCDALAQFCEIIGIEESEVENFSEKLMQEVYAFEIGVKE